MFKNHSTKKLTDRYLRLIKHLQTQQTRPKIGGGYVDVQAWTFEVGRYFYVFPDVRAAVLKQHPYLDASIKTNGFPFSAVYSDLVSAISERGELPTSVRIMDRVVHAVLPSITVPCGYVVDDVTYVVSSGDRPLHLYKADNDFILKSVLSTLHQGGWIPEGRL